MIKEADFISERLAESDCVETLTHWGRVTHICVSKLSINGSDNGLAPRRRQAIIWTNNGILLIGPLGTNFSEILIKMYTFSFKKMHLKILSGKWRPFCLGLNVLSRKLSLLTWGAVLYNNTQDRHKSISQWGADDPNTEVQCYLELAAHKHKGVDNHE